MKLSQEKQLEDTSTLERGHLFQQFAAFPTIACSMRWLDIGCRVHSSTGKRDNVIEVDGLSRQNRLLADVAKSSVTLKDRSVTDFFYGYGLLSGMTAHMPFLCLQWMGLLPGKRIRIQRGSFLIIKRLIIGTMIGIPARVTQCRSSIIFISVCSEPLKRLFALTSNAPFVARSNNLLAPFAANTRTLSPCIACIHAVLACTLKPSFFNTRFIEVAQGFFNVASRADMGGDSTLLEGLSLRGVFRFAVGKVHALLAVGLIPGRTGRAFTEIRHEFFSLTSHTHSSGSKQRKLMNMIYFTQVNEPPYRFVGREATCARTACSLASFTSIIAQNRAEVEVR